jgi:two-component system OmpR family sensor kinase
MTTTSPSTSATTALGLPPDVLPVAFEPFVTTRSTGADRRSGLGLTVVKAVTEAQGGRVDLRSGPNGTRVVLTLPLAQTG